MGKRVQGDDGLAMFSVLAVSGIAAVLTVAAVVSSTGTLHRSDREQRREQALHLAEAGLARAVAALEANPAYTTTTVVPPSPPTRQWVITQAASAPKAAGREGEFAWIVSSASDSIFGIGYVPSRAAARETRVLRLDVQNTVPFGGISLLSAGSMIMNGNVDIRVEGSAHSNGDLSVAGSVDIAGNATATGVYNATGNPGIGGVSGGGYAAVPIPGANPAAYRPQATAHLCPDGIVRAPANIPCTGLAIGSGLVGYQGWTWVTPEWRVSGNTVGNGVFYVYQGNVRVSGSPRNWRTTLLVEGQSVGGVLLNGDVHITGSPDVIPMVPGVAVISSRDFVSSGNGYYEGLVHTGEQLAISGTVNIIGQVVSASATTSPGSPVTGSVVSGSPKITAQINAPAQDPGVSSAGWSEL